MLLNCGVGEDSWESPWTARRSNQSILKEISPEYSLEGLMLKLKLQYFGLLMWRTDSLEKNLMLGETKGRRRRGRWDVWISSLTQWTSVWASFRSWWWTRKPGMLQSIGLQRIGHNWVTELSLLRTNICLCESKISSWKCRPFPLMHKELISERFSSGSIFQTEQGAIYSVLTRSMMLCEKATRADR